MPGPPSDVEPTDLFLKLMERPRPSEVVDFPRFEEDGTSVSKMRLQVLTATEQKQCSRQALARCQGELKLSKADLEMQVVEEGIYGTTVAAELLAIACVGETGIETEDGKKLYPQQFASGKHVEDAVTPAELGALFSAYTLVQKKFGPSAKDIETEGELNAWIRRLVEGGTAIPLAFRDSAQLVDLLTLLVSRVFVLSHILESQFERLPSTLQSRLAMWEIGTGYWSLPEETDSNEKSSSTESSPDSPTSGEGDADPDLFNDTRPVEIEDAIRMAKRLTDG